MGSNTSGANGMGPGPGGGGAGPRGAGARSYPLARDLPMKIDGGNYFWDNIIMKFFKKKIHDVINMNSKNLVGYLFAEAKGYNQLFDVYSPEKIPGKSNTILTKSLRLTH